MMNAAGWYYFIGVSWIGCLCAMGALDWDGDRPNPVVAMFFLMLSAAVWPLLLWRCVVAWRDGDNEVDFSP